jgi:hypothetical protein
VRGYAFCFPWGHDHASAGVRAWFRLIELLAERGYDATNVPADEGIGERIAVYCDTTSGNPLSSPRVARWLMYFPDFFGIPTNIGEGEVIFAWDPRYYPTEHLLRVDVIERDLFRPSDEPRTQDVYYIGKAAFKGTSVVPPEGAVHITKAWPATRPELADLLRSTHTLYTFDEDTMLVDEALLCGCCVVLLPEGAGLTRGPDPDFDAMVDHFITATQEAFA